MQPTDEQHAACDHCDGTGEVLEPSRTPEEPSEMIPCGNCQPLDQYDRLREVAHAAAELMEVLLRGSPGWLDTPAGRRLLEAGAALDHRDSAQDRLLATESGEYAAGYDAGAQDVWDEPVCSICGLNHDRDEAAMCEQGEVVSFAVWHNRTSRWLSSRKVHPDQVRVLDARARAES